jgi:hypothetical protein
MTTVPFELIPGKAPVDFRFTIKTARELDRASTHGITTLLRNGQTTDALVLMTCYGLRHADHRMTETKAEELIQRFVDEGGNAADLLKALTEAIQASGVWGRDGGDEANPTQEKTPQTEPTTA